MAMNDDEQSLFMALRMGYCYVCVEQNAWIHFFKLLEASEVHVPNRYVMWMWSDNFTAAFFGRFYVTVFVPDIEAIQNKIICLWIGTTCSVNVTITCSANLYDISGRKTSRRAPNLK